MAVAPIPARTLICQNCSREIVRASSSQKHCSGCRRGVRANQAKGFRAKNFTENNYDPHRQMKCSACKLIKTSTDFPKSNGSKFGIKGHCKSCAKIRVALWKKNNPLLVSANKKREHEKLRGTIEGRINSRISASIRSYLKGKKGGTKTKNIVGFSSSELIVHLERQFSKDMNWGNFGKWHIDHIVPLSSFRFSTPDDPELKAAWALTNLRPLWADENLRKHAKRTHLI